jgi:transaldolase
MSALATRAHIAHFRRAYNEDGMTVEEFDAFPPTVRTLRQFSKAVADVDAQMRDVLLPTPGS